MSKAFAFAGGRLGYLAAAPGGDRRVAAGPAAVPPVHAHPGGGARPRCGTPTTPSASVAQLVAERRRVAAALAETGSTSSIPTPNFLLFGAFDDPAAAWRQYLDAGVLVRDLGIPGYLRATIGTDAENDAVPAWHVSC